MREGPQSPQRDRATGRQRPSPDIRRSLLVRPVVPVLGLQLRSINLLRPPMFGWEAQFVEGFDPATSFGPEVSQRYDDHLRGDEAETADFLAGLAGGGSALEFVIGTGRIAIPLTQRGVRVDGIELSPDMVTRIRDKPDGDKVEVKVGDMASTSASRKKYPLVYLVFNTIYNLLTQMLKCGVSKTQPDISPPTVSSSSRLVSPRRRCAETSSSTSSILVAMKSCLTSIATTRSRRSWTRTTSP